MLFFIDVDNRERFKVKNTILDVEVKELAKSIKGGEKEVHIDIKRLGVLVIDDVLVDYPTKSAIFKTRLLLDYREHNDDMHTSDHDWILMEDSYWNHSYMI